MSILITGASGYIGQHLCRTLYEKNLALRAFSRSPAPAHLRQIEWFQGSVTNPAEILEAASGCRKIFHLACLPMHVCAEQPRQALSTNVSGTINVLEAARQVGAERVIYASSGQVYGGQHDLPNRETDLPLPDSPYAVSKLNGEHWCQWFSQTHNLPVNILRLFNVYGQTVDGVPRRTVETIFLQRLLFEQTLRINGSPLSGRDFIHISDVINAFLLALVNDAGLEPVNIGSGTLTTLAELAEIAAEVAGRAPGEPEISEANQPPVRFQADTHRARQKLGFKAIMKLYDGLNELKKDAIKI